MKILLVGNYLPDQQESMQRFANLMLNELQACGHDIRLIRPAIIFGKISVPKSIKKWMGYVDKFLLFPFVLRRTTKWANVVHICDHSNAMYISSVAVRPHLITCHDLLAVRSARGEFDENPVRFSGRLLQAWICNGLKSADMIVCVSHATRADCLRILGINSLSTRVIYPGLNYNYYPMPDEIAIHNLVRLGVSSSRQYLVHVGNNSWYKNRIGVLAIFSVLVNRYKQDIDLIMVGKSLTADMLRFINDEKIAERVKELTGVANEDLCALYSRASGLVFPSLAEGFGWPVLEAQASGCPVFVSNRAPMTEVGANAAVYIDPTSPELAAAEINRHLADTQTMREQGLKNSRNFSTANMRDAYIKTYSEVVQEFR